MIDFIKVYESLEDIKKYLSENLIGIEGLNKFFNEFILKLTFIFELLDVNIQNRLKTLIEKFKFEIKLKYPFLPTIEYLLKNIKIVYKLIEFITEEELQEMKEKAIKNLKKMNPNFDEKNLKIQWYFEGSIPVFYTEKL